MNISEALYIPLISITFPQPSIQAVYKLRCFRHFPIKVFLKNYLELKRKEEIYPVQTDIILLIIHFLNFKWRVAISV